MAWREKILGIMVHCEIAGLVKFSTISPAWQLKRLTMIKTALQTYQQIIKDS